ncbi:PAN domain protein [Opisthorchis viverrini]|uniref:Uncharacterized protein n=2 Tax=Opisthorchis viverrini TaxID=6198 RepID=A0A075ACT3_OPIVI|nr:hypothetical protein T265_06963 [Opisthorchis viverrini]KER25614.1 hypothetical protein T265_06963 [Opisthorchis viverrini]OON14623.1 PAN domain protein [Opisthorchis viverrini]
MRPEHILVISLISCLVRSPCPKEFVDAGDDVCLMAIEISVSFCKAHSVCYETGRRLDHPMFMIGKHSERLFQHFSNLPVVHTGINSLLEGTDYSPVGWRVSDPGESAFLTDKTTITHWAPKQPNGRDQQIVEFMSGAFYDTTPNQRPRYVVCELVKNVRLPRSAGERFKSSWPTVLSEQFATFEHGCFNEKTALTTLHCAFRCKLNDVCRSFYYDPPSRTCYLTLFVDSILPVDAERITSNWIRFGATER